MNKNYSACLYLRISKEDDDEKKESNSITNQRELIHQYLKQHDDITVVAEMVDDGYSGADFDRPNLQKMLKMAENGLINCVIFKDLSRFARDHIVLCDYIDQIFPFLGIRMISVNDHFDGAKMDGKTIGIDVGFRSIVYAYFSQDLSVKVKSGKKAKALKGKSSNSKPPYGYQKGENHFYEIEPKAAGVVRYIFDLA